MKLLPLQLQDTVTIKILKVKQKLTMGLLSLGLLLKGKLPDSESTPFSSFFLGGS